MIPFTHPAQKIDQVNKDMGYMIQEKVIKNLLLLGVGVAKQFRVSMRCPKSRFSIWIIVFDELELIIFVSQGLTLLTASLVYIYLTEIPVTFLTQTSRRSLSLVDGSPRLLSQFTVKLAGRETWHP